MFKHKRKIFAITSIIFLLISSCSNVATSTDTIASTATIQVSTSALTITATNIPTDMPTPVLLPLRKFTKQCLNVEHATTKGFLSEGTIFLRNVDTDEISLLTSKDEEPRLLTGVPEGSPQGMSQNWAWMFYGDSVISSNGELLTTPHKNDQWGLLQGWLDSERIIFQGSSRKSEMLYIYNPFTQQEQIFAPKVNDRYQYDRELSTIWIWPIVWKFVPDPTLTRMAYVRSGQHLRELALIDLENNKTLWTLERFSPGDRHMPAWSPDGSQLAVISDDYQDASETYRWEVYTVNRNGQSRQWIDIYVKSGLLGNSVWGDQVAWSPDGRYIAFYGEDLYVLDTISRQAIDYCTSHTTEKGDSINYRTPIIWSPDSRQVIFQPGNYQAVVIDIENNRAIQLVGALAVEPLGWILSP